MVAMVLIFEYASVQLSSKFNVLSTLLRLLPFVSKAF